MGPVYPAPISWPGHAGQLAGDAAEIDALEIDTAEIDALEIDAPSRSTPSSPKR